MKRLIFAMYFLILLPTLVFSQTNEIKISVCQVVLTEEGKKTDFGFNWIYEVKTDEVGNVKEIKEDLRKNSSRSELVKDEKFIPCIEKWKLRPSEEYIIIIEFHSDSEEGKYIYIQSKTDKIKINL